MLAKRLLIALVFSLPLMKPAHWYPVVLADVLFLATFAAWGAAVLTARRRFRWNGGYWPILLYLSCVAASLAASTDAAQSAFKLTTMAYLGGCAVLVDNLVDSEEDLRRLFRAWAAATAVVALVAVAALASFPIAPDNALARFARFHFGTLPPGPYPRLASTFLNANMLCNYLTVSIGMILVAGRLGWLSRPLCTWLLIGSGVAAAASISPGLGGVALTAGAWLWFAHRHQAPRLASAGLALGLGAAALFVVAMAVTPIAHPTAPFLITVAGTDLTLAPSGRFLTWTAAAREWAQHPLFGHGIGIDAVDVRYVNPSGQTQSLGDAHNMFLNIAAQAGLVGLGGLLVLVADVARRTFVSPGSERLGLVRVVLGFSFLNAFVYQGLGGSFEDARYLWITLGLFLAATRMERGRSAASVGLDGRERSRLPV